MRSAKGVVRTFITTRKTGNTIALTQGMHLITTSGQYLVRIRLMANIPNDAIFRCVEHVMQRNRQFYCAKIGR